MAVVNKTASWHEQHRHIIRKGRLIETEKSISHQLAGRISSSQKGANKANNLIP